MPKLIRTQNRKGTKNRLGELTYKELMFVKYLIGDEYWRPAEAARKAGYAHPTIICSKLMNKPEIARMLGKEQRQRLERMNLDADKVLDLIASGLFFNPMSLFKVGKSGVWYVEDPKDIPDEIGMLIESAKFISTERTLPDGSVEAKQIFELKIVSKTKLIEFAMRHCGLDSPTRVEHSGNVQMDIDVSKMVTELEDIRSQQVIDGSVIEEE